MFRLVIVFLVGAVLFSGGCKQDNEVDEKKVEQILGDGNDYQDLIRNPNTANGVKDTSNVASAKFEVVSHDFGKIKSGDIVSHTFKFKSTGKVPLLIKDATSTCGCTVPEIPKEPIPPGQESEIKVRFNSENKSGFQTKNITVFTNGYPAQYFLTIKAEILE